MANDNLVEPVSQTIQVHCNACGRETNHVVRCSHTTTVGRDFIQEIDESVEIRCIFEILECLGCNTMVVRSRLVHDAYGEADPCEFYPPRISRRVPRWRSKLPSNVGAVVDEVYRALRAGSPRLATIGARTIVDMLLLDVVGDVGTFEDKLAALEAKGYVGQRNRQIVSTALDVGSAAAHRGIAPKDVDLNLVMDIVESLLESVYVLEEAAKHLREVTPRRPPRGK